MCVLRNVVKVLQHYFNFFRVKTQKKLVLACSHVIVLLLACRHFWTMYMTRLLWHLIRLVQTCSKHRGFFSFFFSFQKKRIQRFQDCKFQTHNLISVKKVVKLRNGLVTCRKVKLNTAYTNYL